jgi:hypothetical protein
LKSYDFYNKITTGVAISCTTGIASPPFFLSNAMAVGSLQSTKPVISNSAGIQRFLLSLCKIGYILNNIHMFIEN